MSSTQLSKIHADARIEDLVAAAERRRLARKSRRRPPADYQLTRATVPEQRPGTPCYATTRRWR